MQQEFSRSPSNGFVRTMLVTSCLTAAAASSATAATITEGVGGAPADFANNFPGTLLPVGTTTVLGHISSSSDQDWFEFQGLTGNFDIHAFFNPFGQEAGGRFAVYNSSQTQLTSGSLEGSGQYLTGTFPTDGNLIVQVSGVRGFSYEVDSLSGNPAPTAVPEPASLALMAAPLVGALAWRRRRQGTVH